MALKSPKTINPTTDSNTSIVVLRGRARFTQLHSIRKDGQGMVSFSSKLRSGCISVHSRNRRCLPHSVLQAKANMSNVRTYGTARSGIPPTTCFREERMVRDGCDHPELTRRVTDRKGRTGSRLRLMGEGAEEFCCVSWLFAFLLWRWQT